MAEAKRQKNKLHSTLTEHLIPEIGGAGDVYFARAEGTVWLATKTGVVVSLSDLLHGEVAHTPPRHGKDAPPAKDGAKGEPGKDAVCICKSGRDGKDSTVPGPVGPQGRSGKDGLDSIANPHRVAALETQLSNVRGEFAALAKQVSDLAAQVQALVDMNTQAQSYIEFLRSRAAARQGAKQC